MMNVYEMVTDQVVEQLEAGAVPWRKPWRSGAGFGPTNLVSNKPYRGINIFLLVMQPYASPYWLTFKQARELGGSVKKGEHGTAVIYWQMIKDKRSEDPAAMIPMLKFYKVFNLEQTEGVRIPAGRITNADAELTAVEAIAAAEAIIAGYRNGPKVVEGDGDAWYDMDTDRVNLPHRGRFDAAEDFYSAAFHELAHSTGSKSRLDRLTATNFGSHEYGREELVAEMTTAFLTAESGIESTRENSVAYLASWLKTIREDVRAVVVAAGQAQKAADLILGHEMAGESSDRKLATAA